MKFVGYYAFHTFVNSIKKMFKSTFLIVVAAILAIGIIFGVSMGLLTSSLEENEEISQELSQEDNQEEQQENAQDLQQTEETTMDEMFTQAFWNKCIEAGAEVLFLGFLLWGMYAGAKKGSDIFLMADVNLLFTAPLKAQTVLMFRLTFQMVAALLGSIYLVFQIPNLIENAGLSAYAVLAIFLAWIFLVLFQKLLSVLTYTVTATYEKLKPYVLPFILAVAGIILLVTGAIYLSSGRSVERTLDILYTSKWSRMIPMIGWYKGMIVTAVEGKMTASLLYLLLLLAGMGIMIVLIWRIKADFYEDAMAGAQTREDLMNAAKEGRNATAKKRTKERKTTGELSGVGASVFFTKEMYNRKRFAKGGFLTNTMLTYIAICVFVPVFCIKALEIRSFLPAGFLLAGFVFLRTYGNPIAMETARNWLFLVPDNPYKKVFFAMAAGSCSCALDLLPALVIGNLISKDSVANTALWMLCIVTMDFMLSAVGVLLEVLIPTSALDTVKSMIQMVLKFFMIMVEIVLFVVGATGFGFVGGLLVATLGNSVIGAIIFLIYPSFLHEGVA